MEARLNEREIKLIENKLNQLPIFTLPIVNEIFEIIKESVSVTKPDIIDTNIEENKEL